MKLLAVSLFLTECDPTHNSPPYRISRAINTTPNWTAVFKYCGHTFPCPLPFGSFHPLEDDWQLNSWLFTTKSNLTS